MILTASSLQFHAMPATPCRLLPAAAATPAQAVQGRVRVGVVERRIEDRFGRGFHQSASSTKSLRAGRVRHDAG